VTHRRVERRAHRLPHRSAVAALRDVGEKHRDTDSHDRRPFQVPEGNRVVSAPRLYEVVKRVDG
jgi:hypothetical protein